MCQGQSSLQACPQSLLRYQEGQRTEAEPFLGWQPCSPCRWLYKGKGPAKEWSWKGLCSERCLCSNLGQVFAFHAQMSLGQMVIPCRVPGCGSLSYKVELQSALDPSSLLALSPPEWAARKKWLNLSASQFPISKTRVIPKACAVQN